ncbi:bifunctional metallophosphatase/5'-nucleotidase [Ihubacter sp. rT4E-8]|uniref:bifunctional metallophosphatase/5'-nucleotidase n=1 Tax=Ihubacter sp. rT4E-8 TaxID=3242369 RepID=UPI003CEC30E3
MKKITAKLLTFILVLALLIPSVVLADNGVNRIKEPISIVFTHDMHSHVDKFPKIKTVIREQKKKNKASFLLDSGDFSMGTPYQAIYKTEASELRLMGLTGFDVTTLGNHEFDYRSKGLTAMLNRASQSKDRLPQLVIANIDWETTLADSALKQDGRNLQKALSEYGAKNYTVLERGGAKIAVFGIFGKESASYAPESGTYFLDPVQSARATVEEIHAHEKVDMIVCVSHSGTNAGDPDKSEDEILAAQVEGIDLIVSGHSHTRLDKPLQVGDTVIVSAGQYNENVGIITFVYENGQYVVDQYKLQGLDKNVKDDEAVKRQVQRFKSLVDREYFSRFGFTWDQVLTRNDVTFTDIDDFGLKQGEDTLGNLISDAYIYGVKKAEGDDYETVDVSVAPSGVIRGSFGKGNITVADAFNALSLGTGKDGIAGYPLVSVYLTGKELKLAAEIDISVSELMQPARLYCSGLAYTYNPHRLILNRAYDIKLIGEDGKEETLEDDRLYRVVADLYSAQMLGTVNSMSYGILSVVPKDKNGNEIEDYEAHIIYNEDGSELKEWYALAAYLDSFKGNKVPDRYEAVEGRKNLEDSRSPIAFLKHPNRFFWMIAAAIVLVLALAALLIVLAVKLIRRIRYGKRGMRRKDMIFRR